MTALILRLAGPLQSWGEHSAFTSRDTQPFPTRSGLIGMFAAAQGYERGASLVEFDPLEITVRIDRPGVMIRDFHTIGGGDPTLTPRTAEGKRRAPGKGTIVTHRYYLSDAAFTVAVAGPDNIVHPLAEALTRPRWQPYLGRRSCPPDQPVLLRTGVTEPLEELRRRVPINHPPQESIDVVLEDPSADAVVTELADIPESFDPLQRRYRRRSVAVARFTGVPGDLWHRAPGSYRTALLTYMGVS
ncbi:type I-E CRISPR-associated protein Cas5/CasD [Nocardia sp. CNY236]|uniref:type I-E CRISPR-associated protein Cas5/CasD n=1 Tax=Nocardia sp. CNY236 TaxID=1169152 RepID=UPI0003F63508|nr:type I-E CRISPR-associated protein Cas5/CasD [Nocardia sp. CNY236]